jgi:molybdate transport system substrate-binding protein
MGYAMFALTRKLLAAAVFLMIGSDPSLAQAAQIQVLCSNGLRAVLDEVAPQFERATGHRLAISYSVAAELKKRIEAGELFDVAILTPPVIEQLITQARLLATTRTAVARSGMGIAVRRGANKPDVGTVETLKAALLTSQSIAFAKGGAGGLFFVALVDRLGLSDQLTPKFRPTVTGVDVSRAVATGDADLGIQPLSEILSLPGVDLAGSFPATVQDYAVMVAAVGSASPQADGGRALIGFLMSSAVDPVIAARGMERVPGPAK